MPANTPSNNMIYIGFAGPRVLFDPPPQDEQQLRRFESMVHQPLRDALKQLPQRLGLSKDHRICGISQVAIGADMVFARVLTELGLPHQIFLPQPTDDFLNARGETKPDFSDAQKAEARRLLEASNITEVRVVSSSPDRNERFREASEAILGASDAVVSVVKVGSATKPGGTNEFVTRAKELEKPILELHVRLEKGSPVFEVHFTPAPNS